MFFHCRTKIILSIFVFVLSQNVLAANSQKKFSICAEPDNLPMSQESSRSGFEIEVAEILAQDMGRKLEVKWIPQRDHSYFRQTIGANVCDAIMGVPSNFGRLTTTEPWYRSGFAFVSRTEQNLNLNSFDDAELKKLPIGIPATGLGETPPAIVLTRRDLSKNLRPYSIYEPGRMISAVAKKEIDLAIVWGPFAGWFANQEKTPLTVKLTPEQDGVTPLSFDTSVGVKKGNTALKKQIEKSLQNQHEKILAVLKKWRVPMRSL